MNKRTYGTGTVTLQSKGKYELRYRPRGSRRLSKVISASNQKQAEDELTKWRKELDRQVNPGVKLPMQQLFDLHLADMRRRGCDPESIDIERKRINKHLVKLFGARDATTIRKADIIKYVDARLEKGAARATINRELSALRRSLNIGLEQDLMSGPVPYIESLTENNIRQGFFEEDTYRAMLQHLPRHQHMLLCFGYYLGIRKGELLKLRWEWLLPYLNEADPIIKVPGELTKSRKPHTIPIYNKEMRSFVDMALYERNPNCPFLFQYQGRRLKSSRSGWESARLAAGLENALFHDTRRTAVRLMERAKIPRAEAMQITGHVTESVYKRYDIASERGAIETGRRLSAFQQERLNLTKLGDKLGDDPNQRSSEGSAVGSAKLLN